jgi:hypothetical protein
MKKEIFLTTIVVGITLLLTGVAFPNVPPVPVNQSIGLPDTIFNNMVEADCRICHDDSAVTGSTPNVDRHHLLTGSALPQGECSVSGTLCLSDADCDSDICSQSPEESCSVDNDCDNAGLGETCGEVCIGETVAPYLDANGDGVDDTAYGCLSCHGRTDVGGIINFLVERDCLQCHIQIAGEGSVHHLLPVAQGTGDDDIGDNGKGDCTPCHGDVVDDIGDGHTIPAYTPSFVTPSPSGGAGLPVNSRGNGAGACDYCHDAGTDIVSSVDVYENKDTHHNTGVFLSQTGGINNDACTWCHNWSQTEEYAIRGCEGCHGYESLHNIQADTNGNCCVDVGEELPGYGHVGADNPGAGSDCWGCHGFSFTSSAAPGSGPTVPSIASVEPLVMTAGTSTQVMVLGSSFTNTVGMADFTSNVVLTALADGSTTELTPDPIDSCAMVVTVPATMSTGNYALRAVKDAVESDPVVISITPATEVSGVQCSKCLGTLTITGSGFGDTPPEGTEEDINVEEGGRPLDVVSWSDTEIKASGARCSGTVTVNTLFGQETFDQP